MEIRLDASEIYGFGVVMEQMPDVLQRELKDSAYVALHEGIGYAQEEVPRADGVLADDIRILDGPNPDGGSYGTDLIYANQREYGGTIVPRNKKVLAFQMPEAVSPDNPEGWVFATKVTQEGSFFMKQSRESLEPRLVPIYQLALDRVLGVI